MSPHASNSPHASDSPHIKGILFGLAAFTSWGLLPVYWKQLYQINPLEILCHRIVWSCLFLTLIISFQKRWSETFEILSDKRALKRLVISGCLIGFNWFIYIWAVNSGKVVETSLGYYMTPMINILFGFFLLGERFNRLQWIAVLFALSGVTYSLAAYGSLPVFALVLALTFATYGFARKKIDAAPIPGLFIETLVLVIPALIYIGFQLTSGKTLFTHDLGISLWCLGSGVVTSLPLVWFAGAAKRLNLSTIGIIQYLAPSIAFCLGVFVYQEPFSLHSLITFIFIWTGVLIYVRASLAKQQSAQA